MVKIIGIVNVPAEIPTKHIFTVNAMNVYLCDNITYPFLYYHYAKIDYFNNTNLTFLIDFIYQL